MESRFLIDILPQPDDITCGPTCLHAVYRYYEKDMSLNKVIKEVQSLEGGGTLAVYLGLHALDKGFRVKLYSYNLNVFDPTWFPGENDFLIEKLTEQLNYKKGAKFREATMAYRQFLSRKGEILFEDLTTALLRRYLTRNIPILTGLSATYLYNCARERERKDRLVYDDVRGIPTGHFVVLTGYDRETRHVWIADPLKPNPLSKHAQYSIHVNRLVCAIMLGILTYDANLLIIEPKHGR